MAQQFITVITGILKSLKRDFKMERARPCTFPQMELLRLLAHHPRPTCSQVASSLGVTPPTVTRLVDGLVDRGWVERITPPENRRSLFLKLTAEGEKAACFHKMRVREVVGEVLGNLSEGDKHKLSLILEALCEILTTDHAVRSGEINRRNDAHH